MHTAPRGLAGLGSRGGFRQTCTALLATAALCANLLIPSFALAAAADAYEPDNSYSTATPITVGAVAQQHTIAPAGDEDWVSFSVTAGETYTLRTASGTPAEDFDTVLDLYDSDGTTGIASDDDGGEGYYSRIEFTAEANETLYARVTGFDSGASGAYVLSAVLGSDLADAYEPDGSFGASKPITVNAEAQQHTIYPTDDEDWVSFSVTAGRIYRIITTSGVQLEDDVDVYVYLYDSDGTTQLEYRDENWASPDELIEYTATANKTVYVRVGGNDTGAYSLEVEMPGDSYEPDGSFATATPITVGGVAQQHTIAPAADVDWVSFDVAAGLTYQVSSSAGGLPADFTRAEMYDSDGTTEIGDVYGGGTVVQYKANADKTVYARITGYFAWDEEEYEVDVAMISDGYEPDDSYGAAKPLAVNGAVQERTLLPSGDEDWVSIPVTRGWRYTIETGPGTPPEDTDTILDLYDSDGTTEVDSSDDGGEGSYSRIVYTADTDKTLYARATGQWWSDSSYTLWVTAIPVPMITITPSADFGTVMVGGSLQKTITVSNVGAAPLIIGDVQLEGADFSFASGNPSGETIAPDDSRDVVVEYSPSIAYSGEPLPVKKSFTSTIAQYNYAEGRLDSISLFTGFENLGGDGDVPWHVQVDGVDFFGSGAVVAGGKYIVEVVESYWTGSGLVEVLEPVAQGFELEELLGEFVSCAYIRAPDAYLRVGSNDSDETTVSAEMFGNGGEAAVDITPPTVPQGVSANAISTTEIQVSWSASTDASGIKNYLVYDAATDILKATVTGTSATIGGLTPSTSYSFYVKAVDNAPAANKSGASAAAPATTLTPPDVVAPIITVSGVTNGGTYTMPVTITFSAVDGVDGPVPATATLDSVPFTSGSSVSAIGAHTLVVIAKDAADNLRTETIAFTISAPPAELVVIPIEGASRIGTAIQASKQAFSSSEYVVVSTAYNWPDALGGSALAGVLDCPILLTDPTSLPGMVKTEVQRLGAAKVIVLGGTGAVSGATYLQIDAIAGVTCERIAGTNRYDTARRIAARVIAEQGAGYDGTAFVGTGANFPDALGASPLAAAKGWPIYLADPAAGNNAVLATAMKNAGVTSALVLGGTGVVTAGVETTMRTTLGSAERIAGTNRYSTAIKAATYGVTNAGLYWNKLAIAAGQNFPDALAGGVLQAKCGSVMLLTPSATLDPGVKSTLIAKKASISEIHFLGGTGAVTETVRRDATNALQ